jgi:SNF2 family DNA or RNA helicase
VLPILDVYPGSVPWIRIFSIPDPGSNRFRIPVNMQDVEHELTEKVEVLVYCPLTIRQRLLYKGLRQNIRMEELLAGTVRYRPNDRLNTLIPIVFLEFWIIFCSFLIIELKEYSYVSFYYIQA